MTKLKEMRIKNAKRVQEIAQLLQLTNAAVYNYENNVRSISVKQLKLLADFYNCNIDELID